MPGRSRPGRMACDVTVMNVSVPVMWIVSTDGSLLSGPIHGVVPVVTVQSAPIPIV
jgi:hypothetical protein